MDIEKKRKEYNELLKNESAVFVYLDLANMFHWQEVLRWRFRVEDIMKQLFSFDSVKEIKVYYGFDNQNKEASIGFHKRIRKTGAILRSKPVKYIKKTIDEALLFKSKTLTLFDDGVRDKIKELIDMIKKEGYIIKEPKCNFDVEITMDMIDDTEKISAAVLFSGDSDLAAPLERVKLKGRKAYIVGVRNMTAKELHKVKNRYIDFGKFYSGKKTYPKDL